MIPGQCARWLNRGLVRLPSISTLRPALVLLLAVAPAVGWAVEGQRARLGRGATYYVAQRHPAADDGNPRTADKPFRTLSRAASAVVPGDTVLIEDGVYRETVTLETSGTRERPILFTAAPMAQVTVTGADPVSDWRREPGEGSVFSTPWPHQFLGWTKRRAHPDDDYHLAIGRAEQVYVDGYPLHQVLSRGQLSRGTFFVDAQAERLIVWDRTDQDLVKANLNVEASVRPRLLACKGSYLHVRGLRFRYAANHAQQGAVSLQGDHSVLEDCVIERVNGTGVQVAADGVTLRRCILRDNGWSGFDVTGRGFLMTGCLCENNNVKNWNRSWGAVNKLVLCRNAVIEKSIFRSNRGNGLWFDIGNEDCTVRNCLIADNEDAGIFYEISYGLRAHDNVIIGNGLAPRPAAWGANGGITLSSSAHCLVERNLLISNKEGFQFREQARTTPRIGSPPERQYAVWCHDNVIRRNAIVYNRDVQTAGWFAMADHSYWPRALQEVKTGKRPEAKQPLPARTDLDRLEKRPAGLSLEDLNLRLSANVYATKPGQGLYQWGCLFDSHEKYQTLVEVERTLSLESGSRVESVTFRDWATLDLRVPRSSPLLSLGCYPRGEVPGVRLGVY